MYLFDICIAVLPSEQFANFKCFARYLPILAISFHSVRFVTFESLRERENVFVFISQFVVIKPRYLQVGIKIGDAILLKLGDAILHVLPVDVIDSVLIISIWILDNWKLN